MGCDIHCNLEYRRPNEEWFDIDLYKKNNYYGEYEWFEPEFLKCSVYNDRNYYLFGLLAGVRNRDIKPIDNPRGLPEDCCESTLNEYNRYESDYHHTSWYTLYELKEYNRTHNEKCLQTLIDSIETRFADVIDYGFKYKEGIPEELSKNIRLVFWFDN